MLIEHRVSQLVRLYRLLAPFGKRRLWFTVAVLTFDALLQAIGVFSILPFLTFAANPSLASSSSEIFTHVSFLAALSPSELVLVTGAAFIMLTLASSVTRLTSHYMAARYRSNVLHKLRYALFATIFEQDVNVLANLSQAKLSKVLEEDAQTFASSVVQPTLDLISRGCSLVLLVFGLLYLDPLVTVMTVSGLTIVYGGIHFALKMHFRSKVKSANVHHEGLFAMMKEGFSMAYYLAAQGGREYFLRRFARHSKAISDLEPTLAAWSMTPRNIVECVAICGIVIWIIVRVSSGVGISGLIPTLGLAVLAGYRVLPAIQASFAALGRLNTYWYTVRQLEHVLGLNRHCVDRDGTDAPLTFEESIRFSDVGYARPDEERPTLRGVNLCIRPREFVAVVGETGAGKSTFLELLLGLLLPTTGSLTVDGETLTRVNGRAWRDLIGYVPQDVVLMHGTVAENIAFAIDKVDVDLARLQSAAKCADIGALIGDTLPLGYDSPVGERGNQLSGGERQRIGIARALYRNPAVLILDEATSALDETSQRRVLAALTTLSPPVTVIAVTHRSGVLEYCDKVFECANGRMVEVERS